MMAEEKRLIDANELWQKTFVCDEVAEVRKFIEQAPTVYAVKNVYTYEERAAVYREAMELYGVDCQLIVALEELSEVQKEICKVLRGDGDMSHLAEEVADATIMLEYVRLIFGINDAVCNKMDDKIQRLQKRMKERRANNG